MKDGLLSIILFSFNSESRLDKSVRTVLDYFTNESVPIELVIIDDGSKDRSFTIAQKLEEEFEPVRVYRLSRNYTTPYAQFAGLSVCKGDCAVFCPDDLQRPLDIILKAYRLWQQGHKLILPHRSSRKDNWLTSTIARLYYKIMNAVSVVEFPPGGADGFLADREIIDILINRIHPTNTSTVVEVLRMGFDPVLLPYDRPKSDGPSRWTLKKKIKLAADTFFSSSFFPIKLITYLGVISFLFSLVLIFVSAYTKLFGADAFLGFSMPGWTSIVIFISLFSGLNLFSLGVIAEYIWQILEEVKNRPGFIIRKD